MKQPIEANMPSNGSAKSFIAIIAFHPVAVGASRYCNELSNKNVAAIGYKLPNKPAEPTEWSVVAGAEPIWGRKKKAILNL